MSWLWRAANSIAVGGGAAEAAAATEQEVVKSKEVDQPLSDPAGAGTSSL